MTTGALQAPSRQFRHVQKFPVDYRETLNCLSLSNPLAGLLLLSHPLPAHPKGVVKKFPKKQHRRGPGSGMVPAAAPVQQEGSTAREAAAPSHSPPDGQAPAAGEAKTRLDQVSLEGAATDNGPQPAAAAVPPNRPDGGNGGGRAPSAGPSADRKAGTRKMLRHKRDLSSITTDIELLDHEVRAVRQKCRAMEVNELPQDDKLWLDAAHQKRLREIVQKHCVKPLKEAMTHQWAFPFNTPVDLEVWKDYTEKVERPMDFGTIKQNLESNVYSTPKEFDADVQQVFINVRLYNQPDSDVCKMAAVVKDKYVAKWASAVIPKLAEEENTCRVEEAQAFKRLYDAAVLQKAQAQKETWKTLEPMFTSLEGRIKNMKSLMLAEVTPMSLEEKRRLLADMATMDEREVAWITGFAQSHSDATTPDNQGICEIDVDKWQAHTLRALQDLVHLSKHPNPKAPIHQWPHLMMGIGTKAAADPYAQNGDDQNSAQLDPAASIAGSSVPGSPTAGQQVPRKPPLPPCSRSANLTESASRSCLLPPGWGSDERAQMTAQPSLSSQASSAKLSDAVKQDGGPSTSASALMPPPGQAPEQPSLQQKASSPQATPSPGQAKLSPLTAAATTPKSSSPALGVKTEAVSPLPVMQSAFAKSSSPTERVGAGVGKSPLPQ